MRRFSKLLLASAVAAAAIVIPRMAEATDVTGSFTVQAAVAKACKVTSAGNVNFGTYDPTATSALTGTSAIKVKCTRGTGYDIALSSTNSFKMTDGTNLIPYSITQPNGSSNWETTPLTIAGSAITTNADYTYTAALSTTQGLDVPVGSYLDTVTVTVTY